MSFFYALMEEELRRQQPDITPENAVLKVKKILNINYEKSAEKMLIKKVLEIQTFYE